MPGAYVPPHRRRSADSKPVVPFHKQQPIRVAFFGDSFVRLFSLVKHHSIRVNPFKGASAKGLGRAGNENAKTIERFVQRNGNLERCIFSFGSVDVHLSYFYKKYVLHEEIDFDEIAKRYVDFVASLSTEAQKTIVGVYPSPLEDNTVARSLVMYGSIEEEQEEQVAASDDVKLRNRQELVRNFNRTLEKCCNEHGILYADVVDELLDPATLKIREEYRDVSDLNVHIVWETTILVWLAKWPWLNKLVPPTFHAQLKRTLKEYLAEKPWAERTHVTQT